MVTIDDYLTAVDAIVHEVKQCSPGKIEQVLEGVRQKEKENPAIIRAAIEISGYICGNRGPYEEMGFVGYNKIPKEQENKIKVVSLQIAEGFPDMNVSEHLDFLVSRYG